MPICHYWLLLLDWLLLLGGKRVDFSLSADKIPLLRKNLRGIAVENYRRQLRKPGGEQPIRA